CNALRGLLVETLEAFRLDSPMWGKRKLVVLLRREGFTVSEFVTLLNPDTRLHRPQIFAILQLCKVRGIMSKRRITGRHFFATAPAVLSMTMFVQAAPSARAADAKAVVIGTFHEPILAMAAARLDRSVTTRAALTIYSARSCGSNRCPPGENPMTF